MDFLEQIFPFIDWIDHGNGVVEALLYGALLAAAAATVIFARRRH